MMDGILQQTDEILSKEPHPFITLTPAKMLETLVIGQLTSAVDKEVFMASSIERIKKMNLDGNLEAHFTSEAFLSAQFARLHAEQHQKEESIIDTSIAILEETDPKSVEKGKSIGECIAHSPKLVILDGGPGAGKSFGLGTAVEELDLDDKREEIVCLGATPTAAADLRSDLTKRDDNKNPTSVPEGGYTVAEMLLEGSEANKKWTAMMKDFERRGVKPVIMVDESGLLSTEEMEGLLKAVQGRSKKLVLAGDSRQIPPDQGSQPFAILAQSFKNTPAYVNAPYVYRQGLMAEKAITSGIYHGKNNPMEDGCSIDEDKAAEFLSEAVNAGRFSGIKFEFEYTDNDGKKQKGGFKEYIKQNYPGKEGMADFIAELSEMAKSVKPQDLIGLLKDGQEAEKNTYSKKDEDKKKGIKEGDSKCPLKSEEALKKYLCAVLICQNMGVCAYDALGQVKENQGNDEEIYKTVADAYTDKESGYAKLTSKSVIELNKEQTKLEEMLEQEKLLKQQAPNDEELKALAKAIKKQRGIVNNTAGNGFKKGRLTITATPEEAEKANDTIREARYGKDLELHIGEPLLFDDGTKRLATAEDVAKAKENNGVLPKGCKFAYAMDVKSTQGLSQKGPTDMMVRGETMLNWQGGEILVGASRHKETSAFRILISSETDKKTLFEQSEHQYAAGRNITAPYSQRLNEAAKKFNPERRFSPKRSLSYKLGKGFFEDKKIVNIMPLQTKLKIEAQKQQEAALKELRTYHQKKKNAPSR